MDKETIIKLKNTGNWFSLFVLKNYSWLVDRAIEYWELQSVSQIGLGIALYQPKKYEYHDIKLGGKNLIFYYYNPYTDREGYFYMDFDLLDDTYFEEWKKKHA